MNRLIACFCCCYALLVLFPVEADASPAAWSVLAQRSAAGSPTNEFQVTLNFDSLVKLLHVQLPTVAQRGGTQFKQVQTLAFTLPQVGDLICTVGKSDLFHDDFVTKSPSLVIKSGKCEDSRLVFLSMDAESESSFSASFTVPGSLDWIYVDNIHSTSYAVFSKASRMGNPNTKFSCGNSHEEENVLGQPHNRILQDASASMPTTTTQHRIFRLAMVTNLEYSQRFGNKLSTVAASVAAVMARVNGVYTRELGIYFQIAPGSEKLFCVDGLTDQCAELLPNTLGSTVARNAGQFIASRGVTEYDIGHVFTTGSGGIAGVGVLCQPERKAMGTTGLANPIGDVFSIDYVAHELGHQLMGKHSFKHCGDIGVTETSVEPGSGSTILSYSGLCASSDVQSHSHPYFDAMNLKLMADYIRSQVAADPTCGLPVNTNTVANEVKIIFPNPTTNAFTVPIGNYFQLNGNVLGDNSNYYYMWDRIDVGKQVYTRMNLPSFRSWKPSPHSHRNFPNMYAITNNVTQTEPFLLWERLPIAPITMRFRFVAKTHYSTMATDSALPTLESSLGSFAVQDVTVNFVNSVAALRFAPATRRMLENSQVMDGSEVTFQWLAGGAGVSSIEILVAVHNMDLLSNGLAYDPELHLKPLNWLSLNRGVPVANSKGTATLQLPALGSGVVVNFMLRPFGATTCFAFDVIAKTTVVENVDVLVSDQSPKANSASPVSFPIVSPSQRPTIRPTTVRPTLAPTSPQVTFSPTPTRQVITVPPTKRPTAYPSQKPSKLPTYKPTKRPTKAPSSRPSKSPIIKPTKSPIIKPTKSPIIKPTKSPVIKPTRSPTSWTTKRPSKTPTRKPTKRPTNRPTKRPTSWPTKRPLK